MIRNQKSEPANPNGLAANHRLEKYIDKETEPTVQTKFVPNSVTIPTVEGHDIDKTLKLIRLIFQLAALVITLFHGRGWLSVISVVTTSWGRVKEVVSLCGTIWAARQELGEELLDIDAGEAAQIFEKISQEVTLIFGDSNGGSQPKR